nr:N-acetylmuramoyl-L-alanine amidase [Peteryoungia desertarenae]
MSPAWSSSSAVDATTEESAEPLLAYSGRIAGDRARTRLVIDFDRKPTVDIRYISNPDRIIVDLPATVFSLDPETFGPVGLFSEVRYGSIDRQSARLVLTAARAARIVENKVIKDEADKGYRLVLDAEMVSQQDFDALVRGQNWLGEGQAATVAATTIDPATASDKFVIAVDAGHGGIDTGATGATTRTPEKDITLAFAKILHAKLMAEPGVVSVLTREDDSFLSLSERVTIARQNGADLLISLHADTLRQPEIRGATVYTISDRASDNMAAQLAERENLSDVIGGVVLTEEPSEVTDILIDLTRRETQAFSISLAQSVIASFQGQIGLINNPHRYAGFRVLQAHDVPSILLELGFLSNKEDEKLLLDPAWREKVATHLVDAIRRYKAPLMANGG